MSSYDQPSKGHTEALRQLSESRAVVLQYIRKLQSTRAEGRVHPNLIDVSDTPAAHSVATASLADYLLQLRPYRGNSPAWGDSVCRVSLPETFNSTSDVFGENDERTYEIQGESTFEIGSLSDVINLTGMEVVYTEELSAHYAGTPKIPDGLYDDIGGGATSVYQFVLTTEQIREIFERADEVAAGIGFLAEMTPGDAEDTAGF